MSTALAAAEQRVQEAQAKLAQLTAQHEAVARELRILEVDVRDSDPENVTAYARRVSERHEGQARCASIERDLAAARRELEAAQLAARAPRTAKWAGDAEQLTQASARLAKALGHAIAGISMVLVSVAEVRRALAEAEAVRHRLDVGERAGIHAPAADPRDAYSQLQRRAHEVLRACAVKPEMIGDGASLAALETDLRARGVAGRLADVFRTFRVA